MVQVKWTLQSKLDLKNISNFVAQESQFYAKQTINKLRSKTNILKSLIGKVVAEYDVDFIRELKEENYRIIYYIESKSLVSILGIIHEARDLTNLE
jgi:plasmid stabilization system protein ParE